MNKEELRRIMPIYSAWIKGEKIGILNGENEIQNDDINPTSFSMSSKRMYINDTYAELRIHIINGGKVSVLNSSGEFVEYKNAKPDTKFIFTISSYKCIPIDSWVDDLKIGDSIVKKSHEEKPLTISDITIFNEIDALNFFNFENTDEGMDKDEIEKNYKLWEPTKREWCWFWENNGIPVISMFKEMNEDLYVNTNCDKYDNCKPYTGDVFWEKKDV